ncbi:MAG: cellulase family glycosylhydrolase [Oscillospiraceae bacterium]|nr:cellulase family glycosylhydrolase [Oscillospiraceae bacterium]
MMKSHKITALILSVLTACTFLTGCAEKKQTNSQEETSVQEETVAETKNSDVTVDSVAEPVAETEPQPTEHVSPRETLNFQSGTQNDFTDAVLNHDTNKNYPISLKDFISEGDTVQKFIFEFEAGSAIGSYQGGIGISLYDGCPAATDDYWYQSDNFTFPADGNYVKVEWNVPAEIQDYINPDGKIQIGYWWGDTEEVQLKYVTCCYTEKAEIPVDDTKEIYVHQNLNYETSPSVKIPLDLEEGWIPQAFIFQVSGEGNVGKFNAGCKLKTSDDNWTESPVFSVYPDGNQFQVYWVLSDEVKAMLSSSSELEFSYFWSELQSISLDSVTVKCSEGLGGTIAGSLAHADEIQVSYQNDDAQKIVDSIKVGWNLGNTLDCYNITWSVTDFETAWGNPKTTKKMIDTVRDAGFNAVRIPVSWNDHLDKEGNIDSLWMQRVQQVVDYAVDDDLYVILNMHHDDYTWITPIYYKEQEVTEKYVKVWSQIADRFKSYDTKLLFEGLNEPRIIDSTDEWTGGTAEERDVINHLLQAFVDTVRKSGGNNSMRTLVITTQAASISEKALNGLVVPEDDNLILSIHSYAPWKFTSSEFKEEKQFTEESKAELDAGFDMLYDKFVSKGLPVIIGEFGAENKDNTADRAAYYAYYLTAAKQRNIPCFIWDNNNISGDGSYGILNRSECTWYYPEIIEAIQDAVK